MPPLFSVIIACYNHEQFVKEAVDSVLSQSCASREVIAVDDGSSDDTPKILDTYRESLLLEKSATNRGAGHARNRGASLATGEYLVFLDGDDVLMPWALDVYERLIRAERPVLILGKVRKFKGHVPVSSPEVLLDRLTFVSYPDFLSKDRSWVYNTSALIVHRTAFLSAGGWSPDIFYQDIQDLLAKLGDAGKTLLVLSPSTVWYRMHSTNAVRNVSRFVQGIDVLLTKDSSGAYPARKSARAKRRIWFGGLVFYWAKQALRAGLYRETCRILIHHGWLVLPAILQRSAVFVLGRKEEETLSMGHELGWIFAGQSAAPDAIAQENEKSLERGLRQ